MRTIDAVHRSGVGLGPERTIREAASVMEQAGVGSLAIIDDERLVGIVTDRDLVRRGLARGLPADARVDSVTVVGNRAEVALVVNDDYEYWAYVQCEEQGWCETVAGVGPCVDWDDPSIIQWGDDV